MITRIRILIFIPTIRKSKVKAENNVPEYLLLLCNGTRRFHQIFSLGNSVSILECYSEGFLRIF